MKVTVHSLVRLSSTQMYYNINVLCYNSDYGILLNYRRKRCGEAKLQGLMMLVAATRCSLSKGGLARRIYNPEVVFIMQTELPFISLCFYSVVSRLRCEPSQRPNVWDSPSGWQVSRPYLTQPLYKSCVIVVLVMCNKSKSQLLHTGALWIIFLHMESSLVF